MNDLEKCLYFENYSSFMRFSPSPAIALLALFILVFSCQEKEDPLSAVVSVKSLNAQVLSEGGVIVTGELTRFDEVLKHGFYVARDTSDWEANSDIVDLGRPTANGKFEKKVVQNILKGKTYFFKAFVQTRSSKIFGKAVPFVSQGGLLPSIEKVDPQKGHLDDYVKIFGERFGNDVVRLKVFFDQLPSFYYTVNENLVEVLLPDNLKKHEFNIRLVYFDGPETQVPYSLATPIVEEVLPVFPKVGDVITLKGNHFDRRKDKNEVFLGGKKAEIIESTREQLKVKIPDDVASGELEIQVNAQLQATIQEIKVKLAAPKINSYPLEAKVGQELEIKGENFNPEYYWNKVLVNGYEAQITDGNSTFLRFIMPDIPYPSREGELEVVVAGTAVQGISTIRIQDQWLMISNDLPFNYFGDMGSFVINNTAYVFATDLNFNDPKTYIFKFHPEDFTWTKIPTPFTFFRGLVLAQTNEKVYIYTRELENNFWEYIPASNTWTNKSNFPGAPRDRTLMFHANGKIYIGPGKNFDISGTDGRGLFVYDPSMDNWVELEEPPFNPRSNPQTLVFGDQVYVFDGALNTGDYEVYRYNVSQNTWSRTIPLPVARGGTTAFIYQGKGYSALGSLVGQDNLMEFDPITQIWTKAGFVGFRERKGGFSFVLDDAVYIGGGETWPEGGSKELLQWKK